MTQESDNQDHHSKILVKSNQILPNIFSPQYQWIRTFDVESDLITDLSFLCTKTSIENLRIQSQKLKTISHLGHLKYLKNLNLSNCQIENVSDYDSYLKLVKLYARDQEGSDRHHIYFVKLKLANNPFKFKPKYSNTFPVPTLAELASQSLRINDLDDSLAERLIWICQMKKCSLCQRIKVTRKFWIQKALGLILMYVKAELCHSCLTQYKKEKKDSGKTFLGHLGQLISELDLIIQKEIISEKLDSDYF